MDSHHNMTALAPVLNSRTISGRIGRRVRSEERDVRLQDGCHNGRHHRTMNRSKGRGQQIPRYGKLSRRATTKYPTH